MGLDIILTELDCSDRNIDDPDPVRRDAETAAFTKGYLDLTLDFTNVKQIILWSLTDGTSYMNRPGYPDYKRRADGLALRGHPYDDRPSPMHCCRLLNVNNSAAKRVSAAGIGSGLV